MTSTRWPAGQIKGQQKALPGGAGDWAWERLTGCCSNGHWSIQPIGTWPDKSLRILYSWQIFWLEDDIKQNAWHCLTITPSMSSLAGTDFMWLEQSVTAHDQWHGVHEAYQTDPDGVAFLLAILGFSRIFGCLGHCFRCLAVKTWSIMDLLW